MLAPEAPGGEAKTKPRATPKVRVSDGSFQRPVAGGCLLGTQPLCSRCSRLAQRGRQRGGVGVPESCARALGVRAARSGSQWCDSSKAALNGPTFLPAELLQTCAPARRGVVHGRSPASSIVSCCCRWCSYPPWVRRFDTIRAGARVAPEESVPRRPAPPFTS
jgi:hypothetical protein